MQWMSDFSAAATFLMPSVKSDVRVHNTLLLPNQLRHSIKTLCLENFYRRSLGSSFTLFRHDNFSVTRVLCTRCVYTFLCVYVWSDLSCDLCVIEGSGAHMGSTVLIISPRDISGSSVLQCCRHASGPGPGGKCLLGRGQVTWPGLRSVSGEAIRAARRYTRCDAGITRGGAGAFCCDDFALWSKQNKDRVGDTGLRDHL